MFSKQLASDVIFAEQLQPMLQGLSRANWLAQQEQELVQCSLSNWLSLRKPVKSTTNIIQFTKDVIYKLLFHLGLTYF